MIFTETELKGAFIIDLETREDNRGFFARAFCQKEFAEHGLKPVIAQANIAFNRRKGTLRGMHFQFPPAAETKLVRAPGAPSSTSSSTSGRRARPTSSTSPSELSADNHRALYVPERFAHGYQALEDDTETSYQVGEFYAPGSEGGLSPRRSAARSRAGRLPVAEISREGRGVEARSTRSRPRSSASRMSL